MTELEYRKCVMCDEMGVVFREDRAVLCPKHDAEVPWCKSPGCGNKAFDSSGNCAPHTALHDIFLAIDSHSADRLGAMIIAWREKIGPAPETVIWIVDIMLQCGHVNSHSEARRMINSGAVEIDDEKIEDPEALIPVRDGMTLKTGPQTISKVDLDLLITG